VPSEKILHPDRSSNVPVIDEMIEIARPAAVVFDFVVRGENLPRWDGSIVDCTRLDDDPDSSTVAVGARYRGATRLLGRRIEWTTEVVDYVPGTRATSTSTSGPLSFTVTYEVDPTPAGSRLRYRLTAESGLGGAFARALEPIVQREQAKVVRANLATLAHVLEQS
jgi:uncharacterized membrane protein